MVDDKLDILLRTTDTTKMKLEQSKNSIILKEKLIEFAKSYP